MFFPGELHRPQLHPGGVRRGGLRAGLQPPGERLTEPSEAMRPPPRMGRHEMGTRLDEVRRNGLF